MDIKKYKVKIYIKHKILPIGVAELTSDEQLEEFLNYVKDKDQFLILGELIINKNTITHITIK